MIRLAVVGSGSIVELFLKGLIQVEGIECVAIYSRNLETGNTFAQRNNITYVFNDLIELASSELIDAVYIASPNALHLSQSEIFIQHNKHVICEKALGCNTSEIERLYALANSKNLIFMEAFIGLHLPQLKLIKDNLEDLGRLSCVKLDFCQLSSKYRALKQGELPNVFNPKMEAGSLMDIGIYCIYTALALFGRPLKVNATCIKHTNDIDLCGNVVFTYPNFQAILTHSKIGNSLGLNQIIGDNGLIVIEKISTLAKIDLVSNQKEYTNLYTADANYQAMSYEARSFVNYINNYEAYRAEYLANQALSVLVYEVLSEIRKQCNLSF